MHHGLEYDCLFTITDSDFWECGRGNIVGKLYETKYKPRTDPYKSDEPSPSA